MKTMMRYGCAALLALAFGRARADAAPVPVERHDTPTRAADERSSFTDRVQQSQGIARTEQVTTTEPAVVGEATSFIARVMTSQGIRSSGLEARESAPAIEEEATSFIARVVANQGIATGTEEGAASGEPSTQ
jgi:hypothetical protein